MKCPKCQSTMTYSEGQDELSTNELHWYAQWTCDKCGHVIRDFEDDFEFPADGPSVSNGNRGGEA